MRVFQNRFIPILLLLSAAAMVLSWGKSGAGYSEEQLFLPIIVFGYEAPSLIYHSSNLDQHTIFAECNPGGDSACPCTPAEAHLQAFDTYGEVVSNPRKINTYVNAIGYKKFTETYPDGSAIELGTVKYRGQIRLPVLPFPDINQKNNPQAVHFMVQLWDGRNDLFPANQHSREAVIYWDLNPWVTQEYGKIKIYIYPLQLVDTGIKVTPDSAWHTFELVTDLVSQKYVSITVDGETKALQVYDMAAVYHPDWGTDISLSITTESMASWSGPACDFVFTWTTQFRDVAFVQVK